VYREMMLERRGRERGGGRNGRGRGKDKERKGKEKEKEKDKGEEKEVASPCFISSSSSSSLSFSFSLQRVRCENALRFSAAMITRFDMLLPLGIRLEVTRHGPFTPILVRISVRGVVGMVVEVVVG
jgi:hypothetical protein